jgi:hypothetical protein
VRGRLALPISPRFPVLEILIQFSNVDFGKDKRFEISGTDKPPSAAIFTASSRNSFVYRPLGILSILTPPSSFLPKHRCPFFSTYISLLQGAIQRFTFGKASPSTNICIKPLFIFVYGEVYMNWY